MTTIRIESRDQRGFLDVSLQDVLDTIGKHGPPLSWHVYWLEGAAKPESGLNIVDLEEEVRSASIGKRLGWEELRSLAASLWQLTDGLIAGFEGDVAAPERSAIEHHRGAPVVLELEDSSYWLITARDEELVQALQQRFTVSLTDGEW